MLKTYLRPWTLPTVFIIINKFDLDLTTLVKGIVIISEMGQFLN